MTLHLVSSKNTRYDEDNSDMFGFRSQPSAKDATRATHPWKTAGALAHVVVVRWRSSFVLGT